MSSMSQLLHSSSTRVGLSTATPSHSRRPCANRCNLAQAPSGTACKRRRECARDLCAASVATATPQLANAPAAHSFAGVSISLEVLCHAAAACVVAAACVRNVPQLLKCWREKSTDGISFVSVVTEVSCYAAMAAYAIRMGYAPTIWGCEAACWIQDMTLLGMIVAFRKFPLAKLGPLAAVWLSLQAALFTDAVPLAFLAKFQVVVAAVLGLGARVPQIILNFRRGHTGSLVAATSIFNAASNVISGSVACVLTGDIYVIGLHMWMFTLNTTILSQIFASRRKARAADVSNGKVQRVAFEPTHGPGYVGYA